MKKLVFSAVLFIAATIVIVSCKKEYPLTQQPAFTGLNSTAKDTPWVSGTAAVSDTPYLKK